MSKRVFASGRLSPAEFFFLNAGFSYDPEKQSRLEGRLECARAMAMAERWASDNGLSFEWSQDDDPLECYGGSDVQWLCRAYADDGELLDCLGSVDFGQNGEPWGEPYKRVIEAELALGLLGADGEQSCVDFLVIRPEIQEQVDA